MFVGHSTAMTDMDLRSTKGRMRQKASEGAVTAVQDKDRPQRDRRRDPVALEVTAWAC